jgi:uncharacterized membrane protein YcjF (UPF0283 family)
MSKPLLFSLSVITAGAALLALVWRTKGLLGAVAGTAGIILILLGLFFLKNVLGNYFNEKIAKKKEQQKKS